ncbi:MAG TPA: hypothetical protein VJH03_14360 [Blastocatellia bacterium]|nr:hypothetical protein [Blastocatellia bacterium]
MPRVLLEPIGEERSLAAEFFRLAVHVIHELVDQRDRYLLDLRLRVGHLPDQHIAS